MHLVVHEFTQTSGLYDCVMCSPTILFHAWGMGSAIGLRVQSSRLETYFISNRRNEIQEINYTVMEELKSQTGNGKATQRLATAGSCFFL